VRKCVYMQHPIPIDGCVHVPMLCPQQTEGEELLATHRRVAFRSMAPVETVCVVGTGASMASVLTECVVAKGG